MRDESISGFLATYSKKNTVKNYRTGIYHFLDHTYWKVRTGRNATKKDAENYEKLNARYFTEDRDYLDDLVRFIAEQSGKPPATIKGRVAGVKEWMTYHEVEFTTRELKTLKNKMPKARTAWSIEEDMTTEVLKKILAHMDERGRALILTLASSGIRIGEALNVKIGDLKLESEPAEIVVRGEYTKSGETRVVFISKEAEAGLEEWLKVRDSYLKSSINRNKGLIEKGDAKPKQMNDDRIFPFSDAVVREMWSRTLTKAGLFERDTTTGRLTLRIHGMRKFFRSQLALSCPVDIVEALMGHEGYLTNAYRRYTKKQMGEYYLKGEHHLTIFESGDLREIQESLRDTQMAMSGYKGRLEEKDREITFLAERVDRLEGLLSGLADVAVSDPAALLKLRDFLPQGSGEA